jgi:DNA polymerase III delta prime subunit
MQKQKDMEAAMLLAHREFVEQLNKGLDILDQEIKEAQEMEHICTGEWCYSTDVVIDELHKQVFSISEPRWATNEDSQKIKDLRKRIKDLYVSFLETKKVST